MRLFVGLLYLAASLCPLAPSSAAQIIAGRFGKALAPGEQARASANPAYATPPLTVECWARIRLKTEFNILVANESKASGTHWEIYTYAGSGLFSAYLPGYEPAEIISGVDLADDKWHHVAMQFDSSEVRLFVDAKEVAARRVTRAAGLTSVPGDLTFETVTDSTQNLSCDGLLDEVRISRGIRPIVSTPTAPFHPDASTIGLWHMDNIDAKGRIADASALANPALVNQVLHKSLDELDVASFKAGPPALAGTAELVKLSRRDGTHRRGAPSLALDGEWEMAENGDAKARLSGSWPDAIAATVPGSVHTALARAGKIPDPKFGRNDAIAHAQSFKTWWLRRTFARPAGFALPKLVFDGVAIRCTVWLNGKRLGTHDGMFGGPEFPIDGLLQDSNTLVVRLDPAPGDPHAWNNPDWRKTVVFNNVWGWHYSSIPALGIWRSVRIDGAPTVEIDHPFVATRDARKGIVDLRIALNGSSARWSGALTGTIWPENFKGAPWHFVRIVSTENGGEILHLRVRVPEPRLWEPNGLGDQNLYRLTLSFAPYGGGVADTKEIVFGIRTIEMAPLPGGPRSTQFNWTFVINGRPRFIKGAGWCTMDSSMDFSRERYDRFLSLAAQQHVQMLRGWGSGMPETDDFYDLCDRKGILVLQEWPTAWDSHLVQPYKALEETVRLNTLRIRNHPSLAMYGGGNESGNPFGKAIDMMGRCAIELDGTRPFHRGEPWGGSAHNYDCYWGRQPLDHNLKMEAPFFGEFGLACMPDVESVLRYLPNEEKTAWPPSPDGSLAHHTPIFGTADDVSRLMQYAGYFSPCRSLAEFVTGSQLSQVVGLRHTLERARTRWPDCTGALYYKMNDNYPAASWSCVDWYGAPKMSHYFLKSAFAPLHACVLFDSVLNEGTPLKLPVYLLDDADGLKGTTWEVTVRAFDGALKLIRSLTLAGRDSIHRVRKLGEFALTAEETRTTPLFVVTEVHRDGRLVDRGYYFTNYEGVKGSLFTLPATRITLRAADGQAVVTNEGAVPAIGVAILQPGHLDTFTPSDSYLWLDPGESRTIDVNSTDSLKATAWNAP